MTRAGCTIISPNYLPFARTLAASYAEQHPGQPFYVLIVADAASAQPFQIDESYTAVTVGEIGVPELRAAAMRYDILELNTNVKPTFLRYLMEQRGAETVVYLDPDIFLYRSLDSVFATIEEGGTAVLTPHITAPVFDGKSPSEQDLLYNGTYNLGFIAVGSGAESRRMLAWWEERCLLAGFSEGRTGLFVDQKWINLAPGLFERVVISRDPGLNMAYWNLHERRLHATEDGLTVVTEDGRTAPLRFFHFSGVDLTESAVLSRNTNRFMLADRPDVLELFTQYRRAIRSRQGHAAEAEPYGFDRFTDGTTITRLARRLFAAHEPRFASPDAGDPFEVKGAFGRFAREQGLVAGATAPAKTTWKEFNGTDRRVGMVHRLLRLALRVLGPHRYELLMRYLAFISVLRHQGVFLRDARWPETPERARRR